MKVHGVELVGGADFLIHADRFRPTVGVVIADVSPLGVLFVRAHPAAAVMRLRKAGGADDGEAGVGVHHQVDKRADGRPFSFCDVVMSFPAARFIECETEPTRAALDAFRAEEAINDVSFPLAATERAHFAGAGVRGNEEVAVVAAEVDGAEFSRSDLDSQIVLREEWANVLLEVLPGARILATGVGHHDDVRTREDAFRDHHAHRDGLPPPPHS